MKKKKKLAYTGENIFRNDFFFNIGVKYSNTNIKRVKEKLPQNLYRLQLQVQLIFYHSNVVLLNRVSKHALLNTSFLKIPKINNNN